MKQAIAVKLSGNDTLYFYAVDEQALVNAKPGDRVVIANKTKEGGELSMSIGTYAGLAPTTSPLQLKPVVQFIDSAHLLAAQVETLRVEGGKA